MTDIARPAGSRIADTGLSGVDHPALRVLSDVASYLEAGIGNEEGFQGIVGALERGLGARDCRVWIRTPDGSDFRAVAGPGDAPPDAKVVSEISRWVQLGEAHEIEGNHWHLRIPLVHEAEHLGLLEAFIPEGPGATVARDIVG